MVKATLRVIGLAAVGFVAILAAILWWISSPRVEGVNTSVTRKELRFYKEWNGEWYADVPQHPKAKNRMVAGADDLLDTVADGASEVRLSFSSDIPKPDAWLMHLHLFEHDKYGATYKVDGGDGAFPAVAWLCNVTHTVFGGEHPTDIYIHAIKRDNAK